MSTVAKTGGIEELADFLAAELRRRAVPCTDAWLDLLRERLAVRPARLLPADSVRDHVPGLVVEIGGNLRSPEPEFSGEATENLRVFAELRRQQGYRESEVLAELGTLHLPIFSAFSDALTRFDGDVDASAVAEVTARLHRILSDVDRFVVGVLREREKQEDREVSRRLADFVRTVMHELRDPLNAAAQSGRMLRDEDALDVEERRRLQEVVVRSLEKVDVLLADLAMVEDVEATRADGRWTRLPDALDEVLDETAELARSFDVTVQVEGEVPDVVVDAGAVEIPLRNIVSNAVKYADPGKDSRWVRIRVSSSGEDEVGVGGWTISIADNGIGIPEEMQDRVFERRFRAHPDIADGTGLGLSVAKKMASLRGGRIWFESVEGEGSTFHLELREQREDPDGF